MSAPSTQQFSGNFRKKIVGVASSLTSARVRLNAWRCIELLLGDFSLTFSVHILLKEMVGSGQVRSPEQVTYSTSEESRLEIK